MPLINPPCRPEILIICLLVVLSCNANNTTSEESGTNADIPDHGWVRTWGGQSNFGSSYHGQNDRADFVDIAGDGAIYVAGYIGKSFTEPNSRIIAPLDLDPGSGTIQSDGGIDYLSKFNSSGDLVWVRTWEWGFMRHGLAALAADSEGNVFIAGTSYPGMDLDPGEQVYAVGNEEKWKTFVLKLDADGNLQWVRVWDAYETGLFSEDNCWITDVRPTSAGDIILAGNIFGAIDINPGPEVIVDGNAGAVSTFVISLSPSGSYNWSCVWIGSDIDHPWSWRERRSIAIDSDDDIYMLTGFAGTTDLDPSSEVGQFGADGENNFALIKINASGGYEWAQVWQRTESQFLYSVSHLPSSGVVVFDGAVKVFDPDGAVRWEMPLGRFDGHNVDISADEEENIYIAGDIYGRADLDPGPGEDIYGSETGYCRYALKLDETGSLLWVRSWAGDNLYDHGGDSVVDDAGNIYIAGSFRGTIDFDPTDSVDQRTSVGIDSDAYLLKFLPDGNW